MKHARADYNRIQDPEGKIPMEEPVFIIRGQDKFSSEIVQMYADLVRSSNRELAGLLDDYTEVIESWSKKKTPDLGPCKGFRNAYWTNRCIWCGHFEAKHCNGGGN